MFQRKLSERMGGGGVALKEEGVRERRYTALAAALESYRKSRKEMLGEQKRLLNSTMEQLVVIARELGVEQGNREEHLVITKNMEED